MLKWAQADSLATGMEELWRLEKRILIVQVAVSYTG